MNRKTVFRVVVTSDDGKMLAQFYIDESDKTGRIKSTAKAMAEIGRKITKHGSFMNIVNTIQIFEDRVEVENEQ